MKFERTAQFDADLSRLSQDEFQLFKRIARDVFSPAADRHAAKPSSPWPASLRIKRVQGARGIVEMTWSFAGPDGRATFELITVHGELRVRWRRIGAHKIFRRP
ncbi:MAG TPA: hypothetical protein VGU71_18550 [Candidatus Dormibacteraeota bacterium]|nr:hypothetical protein [Candidatus Dormibacteraeota bacterium]